MSRVSRHSVSTVTRTTQLAISFKSRPRYPAGLYSVRDFGCGAYDGLVASAEDDLDDDDDEYNDDDNDPVIKPEDRKPGEPWSVRWPQGAVAKMDVEKLKLNVPFMFEPDWNKIPADSPGRPELIQLGWHEFNWTSGAGVHSDGRPWSELKENDQFSAAALGFNQETWDLMNHFDLRPAPFRIKLRMNPKDVSPAISWDDLSTVKVTSKVKIHFWSAVIQKKMRDHSDEPVNNDGEYNDEASFNATHWPGVPTVYDALDSTLDALEVGDITPCQPKFTLKCRRPGSKSRGSEAVEGSGNGSDPKCLVNFRQYQATVVIKLSKALQVKVGSVPYVVRQTHLLQTGLCVCWRLYFCAHRAFAVVATVGKAS